MRCDWDIEYYKKWLSKGNDDFAGMYSILAYKDEGNICVISEFDDSEFPDECEIPIPTFAKMLDNWSKLLKQRPPYIVVIHEGVSITMQGYDQDSSNLFEKPTD